MCKEISQFATSQIVKAWRLDQSIIKTAALLLSSWFASGQYLSKESWSKGGTSKRFISEHDTVVNLESKRSNRGATGARTAEEANTGSDGKVSG